MLTERYYLWEDAYQLAHEDPEINLSGDGPAYTPRFEDEDGGDYLVADPQGKAEAVQADPSTISSEGRAQEQTSPKL